MSEILIIGAGAAGLMAARELLKKGKTVTLIEARDRAGGRIHTIQENGFSMPVESGAEFIHGKLPVTFKLLKKAGLKAIEVEGKMIREKDDAFEKENNFIEGWSLLTKRLKKLRHDMTLEDFLQEYFPEKKYSDLRKTVQRFAEGFDAADIKKASAFALRDEWAGTDNEQQYRISGGYGAMINFLLEEIKASGADIRLSSIVKDIRWKKGEVIVVIDNGAQIHGNQVIVTVPLGILQLNEHSKGAITFSPSLPDHQKAIQALGFGGVIKILIRFNERFWEKRKMKNHKDVNMNKMGFLFTEGIIPTWWTQLPDETPLFTGWIGGPAAFKLSVENNEAILDKAIETLASVFAMSILELKEKITSSQVINWITDPFSRGAYAYGTVKGADAIKFLSKPVESTIFFAGEAFYAGTMKGTVEAALHSGLKNAKKI